MAYVDYGAVAEGAHTYGVELMKRLGVEKVVEVTFLSSTDVVAPIQKALDAQPDALIVGAADTSCARCGGRSGGRRSGVHGGRLCR